MRGRIRGEAAFRRFVADTTAWLADRNVVTWGRTELPPAAGIAVYVRGDSGKLAAARVYDVADPPLRAQP